jgi:hypothetical protein
MEQGSVNENIRSSFFRSCKSKSFVGIKPLDNPGEAFNLIGRGALRSPASTTKRMARRFPPLYGSTFSRSDFDDSDHLTSFFSWALFVGGRRNEEKYLQFLGQRPRNQTLSLN